MNRSAFCMLVAAGLLVTVAHGLPPLDDQQCVRLQTARDGRDHREEAFIALLENTRRWTGEIGDVPVRLQVNVDQLLVEPDTYRGEVYLIEGRLEQRSELQAMYDGSQEWFVRLEDNTPVVVFVSSPGDTLWRDGQQVQIFARFYKRLDATDRQGQLRQYAAFVGARPISMNNVSVGAMVQLWVVVLPVGALLVAFALLLIFVRRQRSSAARTRRVVLEPLPLDDAVELPDDPAEALAELKRRAEAT